MAITIAGTLMSLQALVDICRLVNLLSTPAGKPREFALLLVGVVVAIEGVLALGLFAQSTVARIITLVLTTAGSVLVMAFVAIGAQMGLKSLSPQSIAIFAALVMNMVGWFLLLDPKPGPNRPWLAAVMILFNWAALMICQPEMRPFK